MSADVMIPCEEFLGTKTIGTFYEFLFAMSLAAECGRRGIVLDMRNIRLVDKSMLSDGDKDYMRYLRAKGCLFDGSIHDDNISTTLPDLYFNTEAITALHDKLFIEKSDGYYWNSEYAFANYGGYAKEVLNRNTLGNSLLHIMAHMLICFKLRERVEKPCYFFFKGLESASPNRFLVLLACSKSLKVLQGLVNVTLDEDYKERIDDVDFLIHHEIARHAHRIKKWTCSEKFEAFEKYGFERGSIAILYERGGISQSNKIGKITRASVIRIDDYNSDLTITDDKKPRKRAGWQITKLAVNKTIEEMEDDYYGISEEYRDAYVDLLSPKMGMTSTFLGFDSVGIGTYFLDEEYIIMPIERDEKVHKKVSIDGQNVVLELDDVECIYWILKEYKVDFDEALYKRYYNGGEDLMYDKYDCTPIKRQRGIRNGDSYYDRSGLDDEYFEDDDEEVYYESDYADDSDEDDYSDGSWSWG